MREFKTKATMVACAVVTLTACGDSADENAGQCTGREILPHLSPINLGEMHPLGGETENPADNTRVPYEYVLLLDAPCEPVDIAQICLVGDPARGGDDVAQYTLEGPVPETATGSEEAAVRITYDRDQPNSQPDSVALVVESNASNFPTLVVPVCAKVIPEGEEPAYFECTTPVAVEEIEAMDNPCGG